MDSAPLDSTLLDEVIKQDKVAVSVVVRDNIVLIHAFARKFSRPQLIKLRNILTQQINSTAIATEIPSEEENQTEDTELTGTLETRLQEYAASKNYGAYQFAQAMITLSIAEHTLMASAFFSRGIAQDLEVRKNLAFLFFQALQETIDSFLSCPPLPQ